MSEFKHHRINHSKLFADKHNNINGIKNFWNQAKHRLSGYKCIQRQHFRLFLFIKECVWRFNYLLIARIQDALMVQVTLVTQSMSAPVYKQANIVRLASISTAC